MPLTESITYNKFGSQVSRGVYHHHKDVRGNILKHEENELAPVTDSCLD